MGEKRCIVDTSRRLMNRPNNVDKISFIEAPVPICSLLQRWFFERSMSIAIKSHN